MLAGLLLVGYLCARVVFRSPMNRGEVVSARADLTADESGIEVDTVIPDDSLLREVGARMLQGKDRGCR